MADDLVADISWLKNAVYYLFHLVGFYLYAEEYTELHQAFSNMIASQICFVKSAFCDAFNW